jgi:thymidylate kinase
LPGVVDYFAYEEATDRLIHVHAHYQLVLGHDRTKNYRLPIENVYLESTIRSGLFDVPAAEFEFVVFIIRMILKHSTWDVILGGKRRMNAAERAELAYLQSRIDQDRVYFILERHLPYLDRELFHDCVQATQPGCSLWTCVRVGQRLQNKLRANARRPAPLDIFLKPWRRAMLAVHRRVLRKGRGKHRLEGGGAMIAIVGGDGAGKSTVVDGLVEWLSRYFEATSVHMGKPAWSWSTIAVRGILKIGSVAGLYRGRAPFRGTLEQTSIVSPGFPFLLRELARARDRYWTYVRARRIAAKGGLVVLDRFPVPEIKLMDGPQAERFIDELEARTREKRLIMSPRRTSALARFLVRREKSYYEQIVTPELLLVLRVDPEIALQRRTDEPAEMVRERSTEVREIDWNRTEAHIIDANKPKDDVLAEIKSYVWSQL